MIRNDDAGRDELPATGGTAAGTTAIYYPHVTRIPMVCQPLTPSDAAAICAAYRRAAARQRAAGLVSAARWCEAAAIRAAEEVQR